MLKDTWGQHEGLLFPTGQAESRMGKLSLVTAELVKENMVGLGKIPFLKRNTDSISGCGFLGDGRDYCVCGILPGISLFFYGSAINRPFPALVCHLEKLSISPLGLGDYKR